MDNTEKKKEILEALKKLGEGRFKPSEWIEYWEKNGLMVEKILGLGAIQKLAPDLKHGEIGATIMSFERACELLEYYEVSYEKSNKYYENWNNDFQNFISTEMKDLKKPKGKSGWLKGFIGKK